MNYKTIYIFIIFNTLVFAQEIGEGMYLDELINFLNQNYKTSSVLSYDNARDVLYGEIDKINGAVKGVYTNYSITLPDGVDPSIHLYNNGMDCEHLWPQSMYEGSIPMKTDMHHLRPCKSNVNGSRGNKPFGEILDSQTNTWFWLNYQFNNTPSNNINEYSESGSNAFEPREDIKGDVARSMFYFYTMYYDVSDQNFFEEQKNILYQWHSQDPTNNAETERTWAIAQFQNDIPNPFIIDNTLIYRAYFYIEPEIESGDVNLDGLVDVVDVVLLVNYILENEILEQNALEQSDMDNNGVINIVDVVLLINFILR